MIVYNSLDYLYTFHNGFGNEARQYFTKQISKLLKLSGIAEKERNMFFNRMLMHL
ncbi:MAG: hypothetical protein LH473_03880 [Chitinophagales bacterium]|nr:hypothetical protein [Chitinophagales bacterium]